MSGHRALEGKIVSDKHAGKIAVPRIPLESVLRKRQKRSMSLYALLVSVTFSLRQFELGKTLLNDKPLLAALFPWTMLHEFVLFAEKKQSDPRQMKQEFEATYFPGKAGSFDMKFLAMERSLLKERYINFQSS